MMERGITPDDMVIVDGVRCYPAPSTSPVVDREDDEKTERLEEPKARQVRNKARRPADK